MSEPVVIARLFGGLGNQLFIYAFAKALAERNGVPVAWQLTKSTSSREGTTSTTSVGATTTS